jgi:hypothetical protein
MKVTKYGYYKIEAGVSVELFEEILGELFSEEEKGGALGYKLIDPIEKKFGEETVWEWQGQLL